MVSRSSSSDVSRSRRTFSFSYRVFVSRTEPDPPGDLVDAETAGDIPLVRFMKQRGNEIRAGIIDIRIVLMDKGTVDGFTV